MKIYGIIPMAGKGKRIQPIGFSKELYPVVYKQKHFAISEFTINAMRQVKIDEIKLVVHPSKMDIAKYYATTKYPVSIYFHASKSLPESCLYPISGLHDEDICIFGLPDTLYSHSNGFKKIISSLELGGDIVLGIFQVEDASKYDSVDFNESTSQVNGVLVKQSPPLSDWMWGIWGAKVSALKVLKKKIKNQKTGRNEKLLGVGFNDIAKEKILNIKCVKISNQFFDIGSMDAIVHANKIIEHFKYE